MKKLIRLAVGLFCLAFYAMFALLVQLVGVAPWLAFLLGTIFVVLMVECYDGFCYFIMKDEAYDCCDYEEI